MNNIPAVIDGVKKLKQHKYIYILVNLIKTFGREWELEIKCDYIRMG